MPKGSKVVHNLNITPVNYIVNSKIGLNISKYVLLCFIIYLLFVILNKI